MTLVAGDQRDTISGTDPVPHNRMKPVDPVPQSLLDPIYHAGSSSKAFGGVVHPAMMTYDIPCSIPLRYVVVQGGGCML